MVEEKVEYVQEQVFNEGNSTKYIRRLKNRLRKSLLVGSIYFYYSTS